MEKKKILLSDNPELIQCLERDFLRRRNFHLLVAHDGPQALEIMKREQPDLVFLDLTLAGMDEAQIISALRDDPRLVSVKAVLIVSGRPGEELIHLSRTGCHEIVSKPIHRASLVHLTRRLLQVGTRRKPRYRVFLPVVFESRSGEMLLAHARNLSMGGILLESGFSLPVGSEVALEFDLPKETSPVRCRGRVVWMNRCFREDAESPYELGVQFIDLGAGDREALRAYVEEEGVLLP